MMLVIVEFSLRPGMEEEFERAVEEARECVQRYDGFLREEPCRNIFDETKFVTIFYFRDRESIKAWRRDTNHMKIQRKGKDRIFAWYRIRVAEVERQYGFNESEGSGLPTD